MESIATENKQSERWSLKLRKMHTKWHRNKKKVKCLDTTANWQEMNYEQISGLTNRSKSMYRTIEKNSIVREIDRDGESRCSLNSHPMGPLYKGMKSFFLFLEFHFDSSLFVRSFFFVLTAELNCQCRLSNEWTKKKQVS